MIKEKNDGYSLCWFSIGELRYGTFASTFLKNKRRHSMETEEDSVRTGGSDV